MILKILNTSMKEQLRSPVLLLLSLLTAPLFVVIYALFFPSESTTFNIAYNNQDGESGSVIKYIESWNFDGQDILFNLEEFHSEEMALKSIENGDNSLLFIIPEGFEESLDSISEGELEQSKSVLFQGDLSNNSYTVTSIMVYSAIDSYISKRTGKVSPFSMVEEPIGSSSSLKEIDYYIPGLMIFSLIILIFQVSMNLSGLVESGILKRLRLSRVNTFSVLSGYSLSVIIIGLSSFYLTLLVAKLFGSNLYINTVLIFGVSLLTALAITASGMIVSAFASTTSSAFIISNFPLMLFMFFSGAMFPINRVELFNIAEHSVGLFDILPTTHSVNALHKIMVLQADISDILYEIISLVLLTIILTFTGISLYYKKQMRIN